MRAAGSQYIAFTIKADTNRLTRQPGMLPPVDGIKRFLLGAGREFYYVKFKDGAGKYTPAISTRQETKAAAIATAYEWLKNSGQEYRRNKDPRKVLDLRFPD